MKDSSDKSSKPFLQLILNLDTAYSYTKFLLNHGLRPKLKETLAGSNKVSIYKQFYDQVKSRYGVTQSVSSDLKELYKAIYELASWRADCGSRFGMRKLLAEKRPDQLLAIFNMFYSAYLHTEVLINADPPTENTLIVHGRLCGVTEALLNDRSKLAVDQYSFPSQRPAYDTVHCIKNWASAIFQEAPTKVTDLKQMQMMVLNNRIQTIEQMGLALFDVLDDLQHQTLTAGNRIQVAESALLDGGGGSIFRDRSYVFQNEAEDDESVQTKKTGNVGTTRSKSDGSPQKIIDPTESTPGPKRRTPRKRKSSNVANIESKRIKSPIEGKDLESPLPDVEVCEEILDVIVALGVCAGKNKQLGEINTRLQKAWIHSTYRLLGNSDANKTEAKKALTDGGTLQIFLDTLLERKSKTIEPRVLDYGVADIKKQVKDIFNAEWHQLQFLDKSEYDTNQWSQNQPGLKARAEENICVFRLVSNLILESTQVLIKNQAVENAAVGQFVTLYEDVLSKAGWSLAEPNQLPGDAIVLVKSAGVDKNDNEEWKPNNKGSCAGEDNDGIEEDVDETGGA